MVGLNIPRGRRGERGYLRVLMCSGLQYLPPDHRTPARDGIQSGTASGRRSSLSPARSTQTLQALQTIDHHAVLRGFRSGISQALDIPIDDELFAMMIISSRVFTEARRAAMFDKLKQISGVPLVLRKLQTANSEDD